MAVKKRISNFLMPFCFLLPACTASSLLIEGIEKHQILLVRGVDYSPYGTSILDLQIVNGNVVGTLSPLIGDKTQPVRVKGSYRFDRFDLSFDSKSIPKTVFYRFNPQSEEESDERKTNLWQSEKGQLLMGQVKGEWSEAALTYSRPGCGPTTGTFAAVPKQPLTTSLLKKSVPNRAILNTKTHYNFTNLFGESHPWRSDNLVGALVKTSKYALSIDPTIFRSSDSYFRFKDVGFDVPEGSEKVIIQELRKSGLFHWVNLPRHPCDARDSTRFTVNASLIADEKGVSAKKFKNHIEKISQEIFDEFVHKTGLEYNISNVQSVITSEWSNSIHLTMDFSGSSQLTRGVAGFWDRFTMHFEPVQGPNDANHEYGVKFYITRLETAKRWGGKRQPPQNDDLYESTPAELERQPTQRLAGYYGDWAK